MADPQAETPVRGRLVDELREVGKEVCTRAADVLDNVAWDRHPGHPDVPVLQPRYDSLKAELKAAEARNEALLQALKKHGRHAMPCWFGCVPALGNPPYKCVCGLQDLLDSGSASQEAKTPGL